MPDLTFVATIDVESFAGGTGSDTVDFQFGDAVTIDLKNGTASGGFAQGDALISIENITGSSSISGRDWIYGGDGANIILGLAGNDILEGGAGADNIDGSDGWDYARYTRSDVGVTINLATGVNTGGDAQGDILTNIEAIVGSSYDDDLTGGAGKNYLRGEAGDDVLRGGIQNDQLFGGIGNDTYYYGLGIDTIHEQGSDIDRIVFDASIDPLDITIIGNKFIIDADVNEVIFNDISLVEKFSFDGYSDMSLSELKSLGSSSGGGAVFIEGAEFIVNSFVSGAQNFPSTAALDDGGFVVTWHSNLQDGDGFGIFAQRYNADGTDNGGELQVNTYTAADQKGSSVTGLSGGGFVVAWQSQGQDGDDYGVFAQRYNADGTTAGVEFQANVFTAAAQTDVHVTSLSDGGFVVTWVNDGHDGDSLGIFGHRYHADGSVSGNEFQINTHATNRQTHPDIIGLDDGGFIVTWSSLEQDGSSGGVFAQRYNASSAEVGPEFQVNTHTESNQFGSSVASLSGGGFVIAWNNKGSASGNFKVAAQRYNADGSAAGDEFQVNTYGASQQFSPSISGFPDGGFVITWNSLDQDGDSSGVYGQRYNADGSKEGGEFRVNDQTNGSQSDPSVSVLADGSFIAAWQSDPQDSSNTGIIAKRYVLEIKQ